MKTFGALPVLALLALASSARAQVFSGEAGLSETLVGLRLQVASLKSAAPAAPARKAKSGRTSHRMGQHGFSAESLPPANAPLPGADAAPDVSKFPVRGIDVSHFEGTIDWAQLKTAGLSFVYIKATDGVDMIDDQFALNWEGAAKAGFARGAYHFYDFCDDGGAQADNFVQTVPADPRSLPPTIDLEQSKECAKMPAKADFRKNLAAFVAKITAAYGRQPVLYINAAIYSAYFDGEGDAYKLWIADVKHAAPALPAPWTLWQYGWHGHVPGIAGEVDLDAFNGTPQTLASLDGDPSGAVFAVARVP
jgi:lysozyme